MYHGDLHVGNILIADNKKKFIFIDFERCSPHAAFDDPLEKQLLCFLEKLYVFRFFFDLTEHTPIELHKLVHRLFVDYFTTHLQRLVVDDEWSALFSAITMNYSDNDNYSDLTSAKRNTLQSILHTKCFKCNNQLLMFHQYLLAKRFKKLYTLEIGNSS